jgi:hypothetical protein
MTKKTGFSLQGNPQGSGSYKAVDELIHEEYRTQQALLEAQPTLVKRFLEGQAHKLADSVHKNQMPGSFSLPDKVILPDAGVSGKAGVPVVVPAEYREQWLGSVINRLTRADVRFVLRQRLSELEEAADPAVAASARLIKHTTALYMVHEMLPSGRTVVYQTGDGEEIPTFPVKDKHSLASAITQASDAIAEDAPEGEKRGDLQSPFVPYARLFYLPQWVAFDESCNLLVKSTGEAESYLASMQSFLGVLHAAVSVASYIMADPLYQQKRYGMLGQLVNQGRALAMFEAEDMIRIIKQRSAAHDLNRGLSLSLPYFDDQALELHTRDFEVIPSGRIMFVPAFVVRASREEEAKVAQDTRLSPSTRKYLLIELKHLEQAFLSTSKS